MMVREKIKGFSKDALLYGVGNVLGRIVGLVMLPILSRVFTPDDYGVIDLLNISYAFVLLVMSWGIPSGLQRFYFREDEPARRAMVTSCLAYLTLGTTVAALAAVVGANGIVGMFADRPPGLYLSVVVLALCLPVETVWQYAVLLLRLRRRAVAFSAVNVLRVILTPGLTYVFVVEMAYGIDGVFLAKLISLSVLVTGLVVANRHEFGLPVSFRIFRRVLRFAIAGHPGLMIRTAMTILPHYMLASVAPLAAVGLFGIANRICTVVKVGVNSFNLAWNPFAYQNEGAADERRLYEFVFKAFFGGVVLFGTALSLFAPEALALLAPPEYRAAYVLVPGIALYQAVEGLASILSTILYTRNQVRWTTHLNVIRIVVFLGLGLWLIPRYHAEGTAVAMAGSAIVYLAAFLVKARGVFRFDVPWFGMVALALGCALTIGGFRQFESDLVPGILLKLGALVLIALIGARLLLRASERAVAGALWNRYRTPSDETS